MKCVVWSTLPSFAGKLYPAPFLLVPYLAQLYPSLPSMHAWAPLFRLLSSVFLLVPPAFRFFGLRYSRQVLLRLVRGR